MKTRIKKLWQDALRSGEYDQAAGTLKTLDNKYCCLGVLCDLYIKEHNNITWVNLQLHNSTSLPIYVQKWAGLNSCCGDLKDGSTLISHNDGIKTTAKSFAAIADIIEEL